MVIERTSKKEELERKREELERQKTDEDERESEKYEEEEEQQRKDNERRIKERDEKKKEEMRSLTNVLIECESKSKSVEAGLESEAVSRDPLKLLPSNGSSDEEEVYRQLIRERIMDGDITTAFKLCCIGHYIPFCRKSSTAIDRSQTIRPSEICSKKC